VTLHRGLERDHIPIWYRQDHRHTCLERA